MSLRCSVPFPIAWSPATRPAAVPAASEPFSDDEGPPVLDSRRAASTRTPKEDRERIHALQRLRARARRPVRLPLGLHAPSRAPVVPADAARASFAGEASRSLAFGPMPRGTAGRLAPDTNTAASFADRAASASTTFVRRAEAAPGQSDALMKNVRHLAEAVHSASDDAAAQMQDLDPPPTGTLQGLATAMPSTAEGLFDAFAAQLPEVLATPVRLVLDGNPDARPERRAYVPCSHGTGLRYNWKIDRVDMSTLLVDLDDYLRDGWRLAYLGHGDGKLQGYWDALWIADDDSNYTWGVFVTTVAALAADVFEVWAASARVLLVSPIEWHGADVGATTLCVVWIHDRKYLPESDQDNPDRNHWGVFVLDLATGAGSFYAGGNTDALATFESLAGSGFRAIWTCQAPPYLITILVRDGFGDGAWAVRTFTGDVNFDLNTAMAADDLVGLVPICIDCIGLPPDDLAPPQIYQWAVVLAADPDLDSTTAPGQRWQFQWPRPALPTASQQKTLMSHKRRIIAFTSQFVDRVVGGEVVHIRHALVEGEQPRMHPRIVSTYGGDPPLPDGVQTAIDAAVFLFMQANNAPAMSLAMLDPSGWRMQRGYTLAPLSYPDTYPETQFKIGSISKLITAGALLKALSDAGYKPADVATLRLFDFVPQQPSVGRDAYPEDVLETTLLEVLTHTTKWSQNLCFDPGGDEKTVIESVRASGERLGYFSPSGIVLYPFTRDIYYFYMLNRNGFGQRTVWQGIDLDDETAVATARCDSMAWRGVGPEKNSNNNYSGWAYDILAAAIEELADAHPLTGTEYARYVDFVQQAVLDPLGLQNATPGVTRRYVATNEAVYLAGVYLEQMASPMPYNPYKRTLLYSPQTGRNSGKNWYDSWHLPPDLATPQYVTQSYGGGRGAVRVDAVVPAGGWVASATDIARLAGLLVEGVSPLAGPWISDVASSVLPGNAFSGGGWGLLRKAGQTLYNFTGGLNPHITSFTSLEASNARRLAGLIGGRPATFTAFVGGIALYLFQVGL